MDSDQRAGNSTVVYEHGQRTLTVGRETRLLPDDAGNEEVLVAYIELVTAQRLTPPMSRVELRNRDLEVLARVLDLDDAELEERLVRLLGASREEARRLRQRLIATRVAIAAAAVGVGVLVAVPLLSSASADPATAPVSATTASTTTTVEAVADPAPSTSIPPATTTAPTDIGTSVRIERSLDGSIITYTESAPAPIAEDGTNIGTALVIERTPPE